MTTRDAETSEPQDGVRLSDAKWKIMGTGEEGHTHAWQATLTSSRKKACDVVLEISYLDSDGFELDSASEITHLVAGGSAPVTGRDHLEASASSVRIVIKVVCDD